MGSDRGIKDHKKVNGNDMTNLNHTNVVNFLRGCPSEVYLKLLRGKRAPLTNTKQRPDSVISEDSYKSSSSKNSPPVSDNSEPFTVTSDSLSENRVSIQELKANFQKSGKHSLLSSSSLDNGTYPNNSNLDNSVTQDIPELDSENENGLDSLNTESDVTIIKLDKSNVGSLGFGVAGQSDSSGIFVKSITQGSVSDRDGRLKLGDRILQVNGQSMIGVTPNKAVAVIKKAQGIVTLAVSRPLFEKRTSSTENVDPELVHQLASINIPGSYLTVPTELSFEQLVKENEILLADAPRSHFTVTSPYSVDSLNSLGVGNNTSFRDRIKNKLQSIDDSACSYTDDDDNGDSQRSVNRSVNHDTTDFSDSLSKIYNRPNFRKLDDKFTQSEMSFSLYVNPETPNIDDINGNDSDLTLSQSNVASKRHDSSKNNPNESDLSDREETELTDDISEEYSEPFNEKSDIPAFLREVKESVPDPLTEEWLEKLQVMKPMQDELYSGDFLEKQLREIKYKIRSGDAENEYKRLRGNVASESCDIANLSENKKKNRYRNVLPFDFNRVVLSGANDYINASEIKVTVNGDMQYYIASQGPLPHTAGDFWQMIWEYRVTIIVMATQDMERGKEKCHHYWPESSDGDEDVESPFIVHERLRISLMGTQVLKHFTIRKLLVEDTKTGIVRLITHLNYTDWPDHDVPSDKKYFLRCLKLMHSYRTTGPIIVHCSAGIGRSGALLAVDIVRAYIENNTEFNIEDILKTLRGQRQGMVQTSDQYLFCYQAVAELLEAMKSS